VDTINGRLGLRMAVRRKPKSVGYLSDLSVTHSAAAAAVAACGTI